LDEAAGEATPLLRAHAAINQYVAPSPTKPSPTEPPPQKRAFSAAERKAEELGVNLSQVVGTGSEGKITIEDVRAAAQVQAQVQAQVPAQVPATVTIAEQDPGKRKLFGGLGSLFSGLGLLAGDGAAPAVVAPVAGPLLPLIYLPLVGSFAGGIAAVGKGIGDLKGEG
jgi:pyruvate/2-oxoglutarate dehydrogenase complex dihydrolipoamide acyltransferase (E2) component